MKKYKARFLTSGNTELIVELDEKQYSMLTNTSLDDWFFVNIDDGKDWLINLRNVCSISISEVI